MKKKKDLYKDKILQVVEKRGKGQSDVFLNQPVFFAGF